MSYRLQLPPRRASTDTEIRVTPEVRERRRAAVAAFTDLLRRFVVLFPDGTHGLETERPDVWASIAVAEERVDRAALEFIAGNETREAFGRALRAYEQAWGAAALANAGERR